ncbi:MAG: hypothetical protein ACM3JD_11015, partial [Rudaea sp.]
MSDDDLITKIRRVHYFNGEFLDAEDFTCEQDYHKDARRRHNQWLHTFGVAGGLQVTWPVEGAGPNVVKISAGMAITSEGKELVLLTAFEWTIENPVTGYVIISAREECLDPDYDRRYEGKDDNIPESHQRGRWVEQPEFLLKAESPPLPGDPEYGKEILLATVNAENGIITSVTDEGRQFAGSVINPAADLRVHSLSINGAPIEKGPLAIRSTYPPTAPNNKTAELMTFQDETGKTTWHINQNLDQGGIIRRGLNFAETGMMDGRLFLQAAPIGSPPGTIGNIGIGTVDPKASLDIRGNSHVNLSVRTNPSGRHPAIDAQIIAHNEGYWDPPDGVAREAAMLIGTGSNHSLTLATNKKWGLRIDPGGDVNIYRQIRLDKAPYANPSYASEEQNYSILMRKGSFSAPVTLPDALPGAGPIFLEREVQAGIGVNEEGCVWIKTWSKFCIPGISGIVPVPREAWASYLLISPESLKFVR